MGTENRFFWFFFRTGAQWIDSLEPLAYLLNDSAYRFRSLQMCHDTHALRCFGYAANMSSRQKRSKVWLYFTRKDTNAVICNSCKSLILAKGELPPICRNIWPHSTQFICRTVACLIHYYLATQQQQVSQAAAELTRRHLLLMPKVTCLFS